VLAANRAGLPPLHLASTRTDTQPAHGRDQGGTGDARAHGLRGRPPSDGVLADVPAAPHPSPSRGGGSSMPRWRTSRSRSGWRRRD
jgi:hypothetical protein